MACSQLKRLLSTLPPIGEESIKVNCTEIPMILKEGNALVPPMYLTNFSQNSCSESEVMNKKKRMNRQDW